MGDRDRETVELAIKWVKALKKLPRAGLFILLRPGSIAGVGYDKYGKLVEGDYRTIIRYIDYAEEKPKEEFLDYKPDPSAEPEDCQPLYFKGYPIMFTSRIKPGFDDDPESFEWVITGYKAQYIQNIRDDNVRKQEEINELKYQMEISRSIINRQKREIEALAERMRNLEEEVNALSQENIMLKDDNRRLVSIAKKWMAVGEMSTSAINEILRVSDKAGTQWVMGAGDQLEELLRRNKEAMETLYSSIGVLDTSEDVKDVKMSIKRLESALSSLAEEIRSIKSNGGRSKHEAEAGAGAGSQ